MKIDLRCGAVEPGKKLVHEFGIGGIVLPVDLIGVLVVSVKRTVRSSVDAGVDGYVDEILSGAVFRTVNGAGDSGPADNVAGNFAVDFDVAVSLCDEVVDVRHHVDGTCDRQNLLIAVSVVNAVDGGVHVVPFDDAHDPRHEVVCLCVFENVDFRDHVVLRVILDEPQSSSSGRLVFRRVGRKFPGEQRQNCA